MTEDIKPHIIGITKSWEANCNETVWCNIVTGYSTLTIGLIYRSTNINEEHNRKIQNAIKEVSKGECIIMRDFNHGHIQWKSLEYRGEDKQFALLIQDSFRTQQYARTNQERECIRFSFVYT